MRNEVVQKIHCVLEYVPLSVQEQQRSWDDGYIKKRDEKKKCF